MKDLRYYARKVKNKLEREARKVVKNNVYNYYAFAMDRTVIPLNPKEQEKYGGKHIINWIIPELDVSSGGHMTIFRFVSNLEKLGMHSRIYLFDSQKFRDDEELRTFLKEYYYESLSAKEVEIYATTDHVKYADITMATGWQTAYFVHRFENTGEKYYFVQDFEPWFEPMGTGYLLAENTYKFGFKAITAGDWLKDKLREEYGMETESFHFSYEKKYFKPVPKRDDKKRVFFYARPVTPRRAFDLGLLSLIELHKRVPDLEVIFAGWDVSGYEIPFIHLNAGSISMQELADCYGQCDMCLVMSTTNLSLMPYEVMASGSVVVSNKGPNNEWFLNDENSILCSYDPVEVADTMEYYFKHRELLEEKRQKGLESVIDTSWAKEAEKVYDLLRNEGVGRA